MNLEGLLEVAVRAAQAAGHIQREWLRKDKRIELKGAINLVTEVDRRCEARIVEIIKEAFPQHNILTEETPMTDEFPSPFRWIVDPLDGTTNYAHGYPCFCTSIALELEGKIVLGAVYDPLLDELFTAQLGKGAFLNNERISVSATERLTNALICTGFPYDLRESPENNLDHFNRFIMEARAIRRDGSAALDLCYVAAGRFDGFWELKLYPWDVAVGKLIIEEAGGKGTDFRGKALDVNGKETLASNGKIHEEMIRVLQKGS
ncbi:MAG: inositol monophosphatase [Deltaproteobacteria bacterium RBG_13_52_11]|nr:MAG: inositol monophosphatase [Deltaproteobacteria bacterium RBG_13_52_11]